VVGQIALLRKHGTPPGCMSTKVQEIYTFKIYTFIRVRGCAGYIFGPNPGLGAGMIPICGGGANC